MSNQQATPYTVSMKVAVPMEFLTEVNMYWQLLSTYLNNRPLAVGICRAMVVDTMILAPLATCGQWRDHITRYGKQQSRYLLSPVL